MTKHPKIIGAYVCLWILTVMALMMNRADSKSQETIYSTRMDLAKEIFSDPTEKVVFVTTGLRVFIYSSGEEGRVAGPEARIHEHLEKNGVEIEDLAIIIHNHFSPKRFTERNNKTFHYFKNRGFRGYFNIYYPATGNVKVKRDG